VTRLTAFTLGALAINVLLLAVAAHLVRDRALVQDLTDPVPVSLVTVPRDEAPPEPEEVREPEPPRQPPAMDFTPDLPTPSLTAPALRGPAVRLDPSLFGGVMPMGEVVFAAADLDQPPRATVRTPPVYPYRARQRRVEGTLQVRFMVRRDGTVGEVIIEAADPPGVFEDAVRDAVQRWRFEPGRLAGEAVAAWVVMPITFDMDGGR
jgi:periplasmic protein TonB